MWRYYYTIIRNIFRIPEAIKTMQDMIKLSKNRPDKYKDMNTHQIAELVKERIENKIKEIEKI